MKPPGWGIKPYHEPQRESTIVCKTCGEEKDVSLFYDEPSSRNGKSGVCKKCTYTRKKERKQIKEEFLASFKVCSFCGRTLPHSAFGKKGTTKDGMQNRCKECLNLLNKARRDRRKEWMI